MAGARLTALDATFLELEQADASAHMHIGGVLVFDRGPDGPPSLEQLQQRVGERLSLLPRYRRRLSSPEVGALRFPTWEPAPHFRIDAHVRRAALPSPGDASELLQWAGDFYSHRLDRRRPLWEIVLLEGLEDGRWALATKTHHCLVDGVGSLEAGVLLFDGKHAAALPPPPYDRSMLGAALRAGGETLLHPRTAGRRAAAVADLLVREEVVAAPHCSLNVPTGKHRRLATVGVDLDRLRDIKRALGGTVNDVALAAVTAGLRELFLARGETPPRVRAMVPVNLRAPGDHGLGNHVSSLFVSLPTDVGDALERFALITAETAALKRRGQANGSSALLELAQFAPPVLHAVTARSLFATRLFNVTVTNVPGPQEPLHAFGGRLKAAVPIVPLAAEHALGVAILSLDGHVVFCLNCDRDAVPDAPVAATAMSAELDELSSLAGGVLTMGGTTSPPPVPFPPATSRSAS